MGTTEIVIVVGALAMIAYPAWRSRKRASQAPTASRDMSLAPTREDMDRHDALLERVMQLFWSIDSRGDSKAYDPLSRELAEASVRACFDELDGILQEGYETKVFDPLHVRLVIKTEVDVAQCTALLQQGLRKRAVEFFAERLRVCGVEREFYEEALEVYGFFGDCISSESTTA